MNEQLHAHLACLFRCLDGYGRCGSRMTRARYERLRSRQQAKVTCAARNLAEALAKVVEPEHSEVTA